LGNFHVPGVDFFLLKNITTY